MQLINAMLVDDHAVVRMGFRLLLETSVDIRVCAEADSGEVACRLYPEHRPDVVVMDISMPGMGGIEAVERLVSRHPEAAVLVLSAHEDNINPRRALNAGAKGYLSKRSAADALIHAIRLVAQGKTYLDPQIAQQLALKQITGHQDPLDALSSREYEVFVQLAVGKSVAEIAKALCLSPSTVGTHLYNIKQKLGASNAAELAMMAVRSGLVEV